MPSKLEVHSKVCHQRITQGGQQRIRALQQPTQSLTFQEQWFLCGLDDPLHRRPITSPLLPRREEICSILRRHSQSCHGVLLFVCDYSGNSRVWD